MATRRRKLGASLLVTGLVMAGAQAFSPATAADGGEVAPDGEVAPSGDKWICVPVDGDPFDYFDLRLVSIDEANQLYQADPNNVFFPDGPDCGNELVSICVLTDDLATLIELPPADANARLANDPTVKPGDDFCDVIVKATPTPEPTPTTEPTPEPTPTTEPTPEPTPTTEPTPEPTPEAPEPTPESTPEPEPSPTPDTETSAPDPQASPTPEPEVLGRQEERLAETGFDSSDLAAIGLTVTALGLILIWRSEEAALS